MNIGESNVIKELDVISSERGYWFVRTDNGMNFETYLKDGFIGIGWNEITLEDLLKLTPKDVKAKIAEKYGYDLEIAKGKSKATSVYNKLKRFRDIKSGDVVIIPSYASNRLAFGIVEDTHVYIELSKTEDCNYYKRKKVRWVVNKDIDTLDSKFYEIKITRHAISNVKPYENYIDIVISTFYFKDNTGNLVFDVNKNEDINLTQLLELITTIKSVISNINISYDYNENIEESAIKLSIQSKGLFALKVPIGKSLATFGIIFTLFECGPKNQNEVNLTPQERINAQKFIDNNKAKLDTISDRMRDLEIDKEKINNAFK